MTADNPPVVNDGGSDITSYEIWVSTTDSAGATETEVAAFEPDITSLPATRTEYNHTGLRSQNTYYYRVRAVNASTRNDGRSLWSPQGIAMTTQSVPGTPGAPGAGSTASSIDDDTGDVTFTWSLPENQGTLPITGFIVEYARNDGVDDVANADFSDATSVTITSPATLQWVHEDAEGGNADPDVVWVYRVRAVNSNGEGEWSAVYLADVPARAPSAPVLTATALSDEEVLLEWNVPSGNGTTIDGYDIRMWDSTAGDLRRRHRQSARRYH